MAVKSSFSNIIIPDNVSFPQFVLRDCDKHTDKTAIVSIVPVIIWNFVLIKSSWYYKYDNIRVSGLNYMNHCLFLRCEAIKPLQIRYEISTT